MGEFEDITTVEKKKEANSCLRQAKSVCPLILSRQDNHPKHSNIEINLIKHAAV